MASGTALRRSNWSGAGKAASCCRLVCAAAAGVVPARYHSARDPPARHASADGAPLQPFGWLVHTYGKAKTGYLGRMGLHRVLVWPFLYKAYAIGDFAEFLETFGLPIIVGKYFAGATDDEKASLLRAVTALGHDARAIMPRRDGDRDQKHRPAAAANRRTWPWSIGPSAA
jgi:hypothetical protein